ncbi:MAG: restriction endonuclease subunit S [Porphyromonadaceae bacterium]|nr:restriction endonuclease subunit S [Porphyromonadaceae bacterium]
MTSDVPNLRFPEFQGEWEEYRIEDITENISSGRCKSHSPNGKYNLYGSTGIIGKTDEACYEGNLVLVARVGANAGSLQIINEPCGITDNTLIIKSKEVDAQYLYFFLQHFNLNRLIFGSGQPLITGGMLKKVKVSLGTVQEQNKLTRLLSFLDERIATQNKIIEDLKKLKSAIIEMEYGQMAKSISHIGDFIEQISKRNKDSAIKNVLSVSNSQGFIQQSEQFENRIVASDDTSNYKIVERNDFAFNPARINVGSIARLTTFERGIVSPMYICFRTKDILFPEYLDYYFESKQFFTEIQKRLEGSVRQCLSFDGLCNIPLCVPAIEMQQQIGKRLSALVQEIKLEIDFLELLQKQKKFLLYQMFI